MVVENNYYSYPQQCVIFLLFRYIMLKFTVRKQGRSELMNAEIPLLSHVSVVIAVVVWCDHTNCCIEYYAGTKKNKIVVSFCWVFVEKL